MNYPKFFDQVSPIILYDPLSDFLGATEKGIVEINYIDVVKYAGHSCPTVAGAYLMTLLGLKALSDEGQKIVRSKLSITAKGPKTEGTNGVIANVAAYICGVNDESGFAGIAGKMSRRNKLIFSESLPCALKFESNGKAVELSYNPSIFPPDPQVMPLMQKSLQGMATTEEIEKFQSLWQGRVEKILLRQEAHTKIVKISME